MKMKLHNVMTAGQIKAYADEHADVCTMEQYGTNYILTERICLPYEDSVTVTVFARDDVRNHKNPGNERYIQLFACSGNAPDELISHVKRITDTHERLKSLSDKMEPLDNQWEFNFLRQAARMTPELTPDGR